MSEAETNLRRQIFAATAGLVPDQHRNEVVDLAVHAVNKSLEGLTDVVKRGSIPQVTLCATGIALSVLADQISTKLADLQALAPSIGMTVTSRTVSV